jgi:hypothetical protein
MNVLRVVCVNQRCQKTLRLPASQAGRRIVCPACRTAMLAPEMDASTLWPAVAGKTFDDAADFVPIARWRRRVSTFGIAFLLLLVPCGIGAFEVFQLMEIRRAGSGAVAKQLTANPWQTVSVQRKAKGDGEGEPAESAGPRWCAKDAIWMFEENGQASTGKVAETTRRYDRDPLHGFRLWKWAVAGTQVRMREEIRKETLLPFDPNGAGDGEKSEAFSMEMDEKGQLYLTSATAEGLAVALRPCEPVKTFPGLRVVFYAGLIAPLLVIWLLMWLISRELTRSGWLRFTLGWPLTVAIGLGLGAGAGFLLDVLDDFSHVMAPYWMQLGFVQGGLGLVFGFWLGVMSWLRTAPA